VIHAAPSLTRDDADRHMLEDLCGEGRIEVGRVCAKRTCIGKYEAELESRLADMDTEGISFSVLFPTAGLNIGFVQDPERAIALCREYNDAMFKLCESVSDRLKAIALLAPQNVKGSVDELRRGVKELGALGGLFPTTGHNKMFGAEELNRRAPAAEPFPRLQWQVLDFMHADVPVDWDALGFHEEIIGGFGVFPFAETSLLSPFWLAPFEDLRARFNAHIAILLLGWNTTPSRIIMKPRQQLNAGGQLNVTRW
jgi:hypothetical protein